MAWACGNCGAETARGSVTFDHKGRIVREQCQHCAPEQFDTPFRMPTDSRIYSGPEAMPNRYKRGADDVYRATDELIADTAALWDEGPTERLRRRRDANRRTEPLTPAEIEATRRWGEQVLRPVMEQGGTAAVASILHERSGS